MPDDPLAAIRARVDAPKRDDETLVEYVERVGDEAGVDPRVVDGAVEYVSRWQYARSPPEEDGDFKLFLFQLGEEPETEPDDEPAAVLDHPDLEPVPELRPLRAERRDTRSDFKGGLRGREPRRLLVRFAGMVLTAPLLGWLFARAWVPGHAMYDAGVALLSSLLGLPGAAALELVGSFGLGLYAALLGLFVLDVKKRVQGVLLALASVLALAVLSASGVFLPNVDFAAPANLVGLALGVVAGLAVESDQLRALDREASTFRRPTLQSGAVPEFRYVAVVLFGLLATTVVGSLAQAVLAGVIAVPDVPAAAVFLLLSYRFVQYDSETTYVTLGPARAGKTMLTLGLCLELLRADGPHPNPNEALQDGLERVSNLQPGEERWPVPSTPPDELRVASLEVIAGYYFPRRLQLTALDYAGQHLERVAGLLADGGPTPDDVPGRVADWIREGDTLVVLLDVERLVHPGKFGAAEADEGEISWGLEHYAAILEGHDPDDVVVVATKCDILVDRRGVDPPSVHDSFADFRAAVTDELASRPDVTELLERAGEDVIHPVYFTTRRRGDEYVPRLDEDGNLMPVGFGHLVAAFRGRQ